jgi:hypothetical protein
MRKYCTASNETFKWNADPAIGGLVFNVDKPRKGTIVECPDCGKPVKLRNSPGSIFYGMIPNHTAAEQEKG